MDQHGLLNYVKRVIHSLVLSSPAQMTLEKLQRDYKGEEGCVVPYARLGFKDLESFLRSISDTVMVLGYGPMAYVAAVTTANTAHIQRLVQTQKKPSGKARNRGGRAKPKFFYSSERSNLVFVNERLSQAQNKRFNQNYAKPQQPSYNYQAQRAQQEKAPHRDDSTNLLSKSFKEMSIAVGPPLSSSDEEEERDLEIYVADRNLLDKKEEEKPNQQEEKPNMIKKLESTFDYQSTDEGSDEDAIPAYALDENIFNVDYPKDAVRFDYELPERSISPALNLGDRIEVQLVKVDNPHNFHFWIYDDQYDYYKVMCNNMQQFYSNLDTTKFNMPLNMITTGHFCAVRSGTRWERAQVLSHKPANPQKTIEVKLIDTGHSLCVCPRDVKHLFKEFATLPGQYLRGRMAYITPWKSPAWSAEAVKYFFKLVCYRNLFAKVEHIEDNSVYLVLVDPETESTSKNLNIALIESGWVRRCYTP